MAVSSKILLDGEEVVMTMRTHVKALFVPAIVFVAAAGLGGFFAAMANSRFDGSWQVWVVIGVAVAIILIFSVIPFLDWYLFTYTITNLRFIKQHGIITRKGRHIPLKRINNVSFERDLIDRFLRCGTLRIHEASEQEAAVMNDVPRIAEVHRTLTQLVFDSTATDSRDDEGF